MKTDSSHPKVNPVVFVDTSTGTKFVATSTMTSDETVDIDGVKHFVIKTEVSSDSHPFYTGKQRLLDTTGQIDKFRERMNKAKKVKDDKEKKEREANGEEVEEEKTEEVAVEEVAVEEKKAEEKVEEKTAEEAK